VHRKAIAGVVVSKPGLAAFSTVPLLMDPVPVLPPAGAALRAAAAAIREGLLKRALKAVAAWAVGWMRNWSPELGVADNEMINPSAVKTGPVPPVPMPSGTALPLAALVSEYAPPLYDRM
jgi:hypothetical protein